MHAAFKEWAVVCEALGTGLQSVIIRKGGIAEGRGGFAFRYDDFLLFPTWFHEQLKNTTLPPETSIPEEPGEEMELRYTAHVEWSGLIKDWERVARLKELHVLRENVVEERYKVQRNAGGSRGLRAHLSARAAAPSEERKAVRRLPIVDRDAGD